MNSKNYSGGSVLTDYFDGIVHKCDGFFDANEKVLDIILYQDAFELVNPLGSAKCVHKLVAVYFILPFNLCFLVKEKDINLINQEEFFEPLIDDLKLLETEGIDVGFPCNVRGRVVCIARDNLGQHWIGEFTTSFNATSSAYVCRFCTVQGSDLLKYPHFCGTLRTATTYNECLNDMLEIGLQNNVSGIRQCSPFNVSQSYHV